MIFAHFCCINSNGAKLAYLYFLFFLTHGYIAQVACVHACFLNIGKTLLILFLTLCFKTYLICVCIRRPWLVLHASNKEKFSFSFFRGISPILTELQYNNWLFIGLLYLNNCTYCVCFCGGSMSCNVGSSNNNSKLLDKKIMDFFFEEINLY